MEIIPHKNMETIRKRKRRDKKEGDGGGRDKKDGGVEKKDGGQNEKKEGMMIRRAMTNPKVMMKRRMVKARKMNFIFLNISLGVFH